MAAGFVLVVVGAVGSSGFKLGMASSGAAPSQALAAGEDSVTGEAPGFVPGVCEPVDAIGLRAELRR